MDARKMQLEFERLVQLANPAYIVTNKLDSDTIFYFLNAAQNRYIKLNYMSIDGLRNSVENLRKATDAFKALIVNVTLPTGTTLQDGLNGLKYEIPSVESEQFFLYLRSFSYVSGTYMDVPDQIAGVDNKATVPNRLIENEEVESILSSYFNKPILRNPCCVLESELGGKVYIVVYVDSYTKLKGLNLTYIRKPKKFDVIVGTNTVNQCELSENVHQEIVELAVEMFITEAAYRISGGERPDRRTPNTER